MKFLFSIVYIFVALSANANTLDSVYAKDSPLPDQLKSLILKTLEEKCHDVISPFGLHETQSYVVSGVDNGIPYQFYTSYFFSDYLKKGGETSVASFTVITESNGEEENREFTFDDIISDSCEY